jgi:uncharacterized protein
MEGARAGSCIAFTCHGPERFDVSTADGLRLATDVYLPATHARPIRGPVPALLERTPYSRRRPFLVQTARYFTRRGYAVVLQDVRGRFDSEGAWNFLTAAEGPDGAATMDWITSQPWSDGRVATMGLSFSTANQQALALHRPAGLAAQCLFEGGYSYFHRTVRHAGAFELGVMLPYAYRTALEQRAIREDPVKRRAFEDAFARHDEWLPRLPFRASESPLRFVPECEAWFLEAQQHAEYDAYWQHDGWNMAEHIARYPDVPTMLEASWYGHHVWATTEKFVELRRRNRSPVSMILGPWLHGYDDFARTWAGDVDLGSESTFDVNDERLRWFDQFVRGFDTGVATEPSVRLFVMGGGSGRRTLDGRLDHGGAWRSEHDWPLARAMATPFYLHADGTLTTTPPAGGEPPSRFVFDPADPVPTIGGGTQTSRLSGFIQGGGFDQRGRRDLWTCRDTRPLAERSDVLVFQTSPLENDVEITGPIRVRLWVATSTPDTDFTAKLIDVYPASPDYPDGYALNLTDGILRMRFRRSWTSPEPVIPGDVYEITIEPQAISNRFVAGHRIRLDVSSSNFPRFDVNPNTGEPLGRHTGTRPATQTVFHDSVRRSHVVLPVIPT